MESHHCASAASDHSEGVAGGHEQHCSQIPQQMIFNAASQGHPRHLSGHNHMPPQHSHTLVPQQQYISAEPNMHSGQALAKQTPADIPAVCSALTGEVPLHGQLMSSVQPNMQTYSETKPHQRHSSSHEQAAAVYGNISGPVTSMPGHVFRSPNAMHQNLESMVVAGHLPGEDGHVPHGGYYPMPPHGQHMQNSGQISWHTQRHYMSPGGQGNIPGQVYVSGAQVRFHSQMPVPFRIQHPRYVMNQEYGDVYCQQYHPVYGELNSGSPRGTFPPQQHCVVPNGQRIMFTRPPMHAPYHHPHVSADAKFVYYTPHKSSGASQQLSPSWSSSAQLMRSGIPVGYGNQPAWQQPVPVACGGPLPGQRMPGYHMSPEPRMNPELCDNLGGTRQHLSPSQSFSPGVGHCYRPSSNQGVHSGMMNVDDKYIETCHALADGNRNGTPASQEYISPTVTSTNVSTVTVCTTVSNTSSKNDNVVTLITTASHPLEHLPDGRTPVSHNTRVIDTDASDLSSFNHLSYYGHGTNVSASWSVSCSGEYYSYHPASQYTQHQHAGRHVNPHNYYASQPRVPYSGISYYPVTRCSHPYQSHVEGMQWQRQVAEHPLHECRNVLPDGIASQQHLEQESLTPVANAVTTCYETSIVAAISSSACSASAPVLSERADKQNVSYTDMVLVARSVSLQSTASNVGSHLPFPGSSYSTASSAATASLNCSDISQVVVTPASTLDSVHMAPSEDPEIPLTNKDILLVQSKNTENVIAVPRHETESQNSLQVTSNALSSTCKSSKASKRSGSRKATRPTKTKRKKTNLPLDTDEFCGDSAAVTCADAVKCTALGSLCSSSSVSHAISPLKLMSGPESLDICPVTSSGSENAGVVVPYGWRRHIDNGTVVYYRLHSLIIFTYCSLSCESLGCLLVVNSAKHRGNNNCWSFSICVSVSCRWMFMKF